MGFLSRKKPASATSPALANDFIGRKFSSSLTLSECLENFSNAAGQCYPTEGGLVNVAWQPPSRTDGVVSSQGGPAAVSPARFVALNLAGGDRLHLAIWEGSVGYDGVSGSTREMWFVPPGFDNSPIPIAGTWKGLDVSLSSIVGTVESAFWGA